jgi:hypothetical protein
MVAYDAAIWDGLLVGAAAETERSSGAAIGPLLNARGCIQTQPGATACPACGGPPASRQVTYRISVAWQGGYSTVAPPVAETCGSGVYNDPRTGLADESFRRLVSIDVYTVIPCACP